MSGKVPYCVKTCTWVAHFHPCAGARGALRVAMALSKLSDDEQGIIFGRLCNVLDPGTAVALSSVSNELRAATQALLQPLKTGHEAAAALCRKLGHRNCKELREAKEVPAWGKGLAAGELKPVSYTHLRAHETSLPSRMPSSA